MPKLRVIKKTGDDDTKQREYKPEHYTLWGDQAQTAFKQGWYPETHVPDSQGRLVYKSGYDLFNKVEIPGQKDLGETVIIGKPNNKMDIVIRDKAGKILKTVMPDVAPNIVQGWLTNQQNSLLVQRHNSIQQGTNIDRPNAKGVWAAY